MSFLIEPYHTYIPTMDVHLHMFYLYAYVSRSVYTCMYFTGAGVGEGVSYQGVHVDDGSAAVGTLDHLVHQTVCFPFTLCIYRGNPTQGGMICSSPSSSPSSSLCQSSFSPTSPSTQACLRREGRA